MSIVKKFLLPRIGIFARISSGMKDDIYLTRAELMALLKIRPSTVSRLMKSRAFPFFRVGRRVLFKRSDIDKWMMTRRVK